MGHIYALRCYANQTILHIMTQSIFSLLFIHSTATRRNWTSFGSYKHVNIWYQILCSRNFWRWVGMRIRRLRSDLFKFETCKFNENSCSQVRTLAWSSMLVQRIDEEGRRKRGNCPPGLSKGRATGTDVPFHNSIIGLRRLRQFFQVSWLIRWFIRIDLKKNFAAIRAPGKFRMFFL